MRGACVLALVSALASAACDLARDLSTDRFACGKGGPCGQDAGSGDASTAGDAGVPPCDPVFGTRVECGGSLSGRWRYRRACASTYALEDLSTCPGSAKLGQTITVTGTLTASEHELSADCSVHFDEDLQVPSICAMQLGGCESLGNMFAGFGITVSCSSVADACRCHASGTSGCIGSGTYALSSPELCAGGKTYGYCARDQVLEYARTGLEAPETHRFVFVLTRE
jgi:hypothetical protein